VAVKTGILGKDSDRNEYWYFKDEPGRLFIKKYEPIGSPMQIEDGGANDEEALQKRETIGKWFFYDQEDEFEQLMLSLNAKGIRERKLGESLRKVADKLRLTPKKAAVH